MTQHDEPGKSRRIFRFGFGVSFRVRPVGEIKEALRKLDKWGPSPELEEKERRMQRVEMGLVRTRAASKSQKYNNLRQHDFPLAISWRV